MLFLLKLLWDCFRLPDHATPETMTRTEEINNQLADVWAGFIQHFRFDIHHNILHLKIKVFETEDSGRDYEVVIGGISDYFLHERSSEIFYMETLELTSIEYDETSCANPFTFDVSQNIEGYGTRLQGRFNIFMEIWENLLYIKANHIRINNETYELL